LTASITDVIATRLSRVPPFERGLTLGDFLVPIRLGERAAIWQRNLLMVLVGTALMIVGAYVSFDVPALAIGDIYVPANPYVPVSLQTLSALLVGATLGARRGFASTGLYLLLGCIGLPVFALNAQGTHESSFRQIATVVDGQLVLGTTGGYLIGFVIAATLVGRLAELGWDRKLRGSIAAMVIGNVVIFTIGVTWLALAASLSVSDALLYGLWPFLPGEVVKLIVAAGLLPIGWRLVARRDHDL
jgi:biotin transport system substrate-specific component